MLSMNDKGKLFYTASEQLKIRNRRSVIERKHRLLHRNTAGTFREYCRGECYKKHLQTLLLIVLQNITRESRSLFHAHFSRLWNVSCQITFHCSFLKRLDEGNYFPCSRTICRLSDERYYKTFYKNTYRGTVIGGREQQQL